MARKALDRTFYEVISYQTRHEALDGIQTRAERADGVAELLGRFG